MAVSPLKFAKKSTPANFKSGLNRLSTDAAFRASVEADPSKLTSTYALSLTELHALRQAAQLSGVSMTSINKAKAAALTHAGGVAADDINVSCCCCCCCGETSVMRVHA